MIINQPDTRFRTLLEKLLEIKDRDLRIQTLDQARTAIDRGIHIGGAFSCMIPLVTLYYGGILNFDAVNPTAPGQDLFVLSKGHAVAALASVYADLGIIDAEVLKGSRSWKSILNGHPGPLLPGVHTATGPMGQGIAVAQGLALAGNLTRLFDVFTITGDGELQEGMAWEAIMHSGDKGLSNLCVIVDNNHGQLDDPTRLHLDMSGLAEQFRAFGWKSSAVDATRYGPVLDALTDFKNGPRDGRPTAIIARTEKGFGGMAAEMQKHKTVLKDDVIDTEITYQRQIRAARVAELGELLAVHPAALGTARSTGKGMNLELKPLSGDHISVSSVHVSPKVRRPVPRDKHIRTRSIQIEPLDPTKHYTSDQVIEIAMRGYGKDPRLVSVDADLSSTSGLQHSIAISDRRRALNVGVAEANMMAIGEAFAILGYNAWVSTFCPFFSWNVLRRIAVSHQERLEVIATDDGWLSEGHGLDLTFLATAPNFETRTNGATHMGNDDVMAFRSVAHLKIVDVSCPELLLSVVSWIMEGNRGLVYVRVMRGESPVLYPASFGFEYARAFAIHDVEDPRAIIISSGREVHEAIHAADLLAKDGIAVQVIDMPSLDTMTLSEVCTAGVPIVVPEQNNGYIASSLYEYLGSTGKASTASVVALNALAADGSAQFIHSGTYEELVDAFGLSAEKLAATIRTMV